MHCIHDYVVTLSSIPDILPVTGGDWQEGENYRRTEPNCKRTAAAATSCQPATFQGTGSGKASVVFLPPRKLTWNQSPVYIMSENCTFVFFSPGGWQRSAQSIVRERWTSKPHAATLTALQRPPLTFAVIPNTITPYCHTQPPPSSQSPSHHLYCKQPPINSGQAAGKPLPVSQLATWERAEVTVNSQH